MFWYLFKNYQNFGQKVIVARHPQDPGSIPGRVVSRLRFFRGFSLNFKTNIKEIYTSFVLDTIRTSQSAKTIYHPYKDRDGLWL